MAAGSKVSTGLPADKRRRKGGEINKPGTNPSKGLLVFGQAHPGSLLARGHGKIGQAIHGTSTTIGHVSHLDKLNEPDRQTDRQTELNLRAQ